MKLWIVYVWMAEDHWLLGIYDSKQAADEAIDKYMSYFDEDYTLDFVKELITLNDFSDMAKLEAIRWGHMEPEIKD